MDRDAGCRQIDGARDLQSFQGAPDIASPKFVLITDHRVDVHVRCEIDALRDDVKPFLRSYFNALAAMLSGENLSLWEHFHDSGAWNKTHETGWFL